MKQKLNAKDFILIGVLTALMWIICMVISTIMSVAGPVTNVFYPSVVAIPNGIVMMLLLAKVPKKGVFTICAAIQAILFLLVGAFWFIPIGLVIGGIICDFLVMSRNEITMKSMMAAYALFSAIFAFSAICPIKFLQSAFVGAIGFVSYFLAGEVVSLALMLVYGLFIALGNGGKWAVKMIVTYIIVAYLNALLRYVQVPVLSVIMSVFGVTVLKLIPIMMMGLWILRTTYMDDLMVALQRMRLPQAVTIPLVVMFRYIPTLRIEYRQIRSTMDIRGISDTVWKRVSHPLATIEYILIPLLMRCLKVTDELAASGTTRGLELECKRYALRPIRFSWREIVVSLLGILFLVGLLFIDQTKIGEIILWRV